MNCKCKCLKNAGTVERVQHCLEEVMAIDPDELERLVQQAHEYDRHVMTKPPETFTVSRQAIRMLWKFRNNLESVHIHTGPDTDV